MIKNIVTAIFAAAVFTLLLFTNRIQDIGENTASYETVTAFASDVTEEETATGTDGADSPITEEITEWIPPEVSLDPILNPQSASDARAPVLLPPGSSADACDFFDDAAFIGDSVSVMLSWYAANGELGEAVFLTKESYSMAHAAGGSMLLDYGGDLMSPEDALAESGARKVFIMLGMNDVAAYGIERTMENWNTVIPRIREKCPDIQIYIQSCTPVWTGGEVDALNNANMDEFNRRLKGFADDNGCCFIDIAPYMKDSTGGLASIYCSDSYVHLTNEGASAWTKILLAYADAIENNEN